MRFCMAFIEEIYLFETSRAALAHVQDLSMQCKTTTIGACGPVNSETIGGGAVENELALYCLVSPRVSQWRRTVIALAYWPV